MRYLIESFAKIHNKHVCLSCTTGPGPERGKQAVIRKNDFAKNHAQEEIKCSEFEDVSLGYLH